ncbi:MAG: metal-dependent hydrolase [Enterococcus sp.]
MQITYHGHSCLSLVVANERIMIDPFITGNPLSDLTVEDVRVDWLLITHGHGDHIGDMIQLAKNNDAVIIGSAEIATYAQNQGVRAHGMNIGGTYTFPFGKVKMVYAQHSSGYTVDGVTHYMGEAAGYILESEGVTIYHAGDTAYYSDMQLIGEDFSIDCAFLPIGDNYTMGISDAVRAVKSIQAKKVIPIHYNTFEEIKQNPEDFTKRLAGKGYVMRSGETMEV